MDSNVKHINSKGWGLMTNKILIHCIIYNKQGQGDPVPTVQWRKLVSWIHLLCLLCWILLPPSSSSSSVSEPNILEINFFLLPAFPATTTAWKLRFQRSESISLLNSFWSCWDWSFWKKVESIYFSRWWASSWVCDGSWCWNLRLPGIILSKMQKCKNKKQNMQKYKMKN